MPYYDYFCKDCRAEFTIHAGMNDSRDDVVCGECRSSHVRRVYSSIIFGKGSRSPAPAAGCSGCSPQGCGCRR